MCHFLNSSTMLVNIYCDSFDSRSILASSEKSSSLPENQ